MPVGGPVCLSVRVGTLVHHSLEGDKGVARLLEGICAMRSCAPIIESREPRRPARADLLLSVGGWRPRNQTL